MERINYTYCILEVIQHFFPTGQSFKSTTVRPDQQGHEEFTTRQNFPDIKQDISGKGLAIEILESEIKSLVLRLKTGCKKYNLTRLFCKLNSFFFVK
jgi:hypothetical protein